MSISTFNGLNTAFRGLQAQQRALDVVSHNIANANTDGYSRQEAVLTAAPSIAAPSTFGMINPGQLGQGAQVLSYQRYRDAFNDNALRQQMGQQSGAQVSQDMLQRVELTLPEPGDNGLQSIMAKFWSSFQDVASNPENIGARQALAQQSQTMCAAFNTASTDLTAQLQDADTQANAAVDQINAISTQIASLNDSISKLVGLGQSPNDLLDSRDKLLDNLAQLGNMTVSYSGNSVATVTVGGLTVVDPSGATPRTRADFDGQFPTAMSATSGKLGALLDTFQNVIPGYSTQLDKLASALNNDINVQQQKGFDLNGAPGGLFFASATITSASQFTMNPAVLQDPRLIAASGSATSGPGDSANAVAMIGLSTSSSPGLGTTYNDYYTSLISGLGVAAQSANRASDTTTAVVNTLTDQRQSTSGVSLDEEMTNLVQYQHAFAAAGRCITTMSEMLDTIIQMVS
jgi:flagellar hook-associated protein 1 FlgK